MSIQSLGDLARAFALRQQNTALKNNIQDLNQELVTGMTSDIADHLGGSYSRLTSIERDLRVLDGFSVAIAESEQFTNVMQSRMEQVREIANQFSQDLIAADASNTLMIRDALADEGRQQFTTIVSMLNSQVAGRSIFSGDATDQPALVKAETLMAELEAVVAGATTAADVETALDTWFNDPAGFDAFAYSGSASPLSPFQVSETASVQVDIRANDPAFKAALQSTAMAALATSASVALPPEEQGTLFRRSGESMFAAERAVVAVQARLGLAEQTLAEWSVRTQTEITGTEFAKGALLKVDPYEAATSLETAQFQLESLYAVTVRLSQLSLVNFLR